MPTIGKAIRYSDKAIEQLSQVTEADIEAARSLVRSAVPPRYRSILDASIAGGSVTASSPYAWDPKAGGYIHVPTGRHIQPLELRNQAIEPMIARSKQTQRAISNQLQNQEITLAEWQTQMIGQVKQAQVASALVANGGQKNTNENDKEEIALLILALLLLLNGFSQEIQSKKQPLNGLLLLRSDLYANAARGTYEDVGGYVASTYLGKTEERRLLSPADHCHADGNLIGCVELAAQGWQPIGSLPSIGKTPCRSNCRCRKVYR